MGGQQPDLPNPSPAAAAAAAAEEEMEADADAIGVGKQDRVHVLLIGRALVRMSSRMHDGPVIEEDEDKGAVRFDACADNDDDDDEADDDAVVAAAAAAVGKDKEDASASGCLLLVTSLICLISSVSISFCRCLAASPPLLGVNIPDRDDADVPANDDREGALDGENDVVRGEEEEEEEEVEVVVAEWDGRSFSETPLPSFGCCWCCCCCPMRG